MTARKQRHVRLSDSEVSALSDLFKALGINGQRGTHFNAGLIELAAIAEYAMAETVASINIARACASGEDWDELVQIIRPKYTEIQ